MTDYYSQNGEDFILDQMFPDKTDGFFVEVGCIDGKRFSNTLHFEQKGWKGLCIEAHPDYIPLLIANRPNSIVCHCAVGEKDQDDVIFYANNRGSLSTLDKSLEARWKKDYAAYFHGFEEKHVPMKSLDTIFREYHMTHIDILSIDIEGYEVNALKGLNFSLVRPQVIVVESDDRAHEKELDTILRSKGYTKSVRISGNIFFVANPVFHQRVKDKIFEDIKVIHTRHPLDEGDDQIRFITISTRSESQNSLEKKLPFKDLLNGLLNIVMPESKERPPLPKNNIPSSRFTFFDIGFHGDQYLLDTVDGLTQTIDTFIETGANVGSTLAYFARKYPRISCYSCEPDVEAFHQAQQNTANLANITLYNQTSQDFLSTLERQHPELVQKRILFWLDAHGYGFKWPLKAELAFITEKFPQALILIDDFKVPGREMFEYDQYEGQICSYEYVRDALNPSRSYTVYYPNYTEHTSRHHPLRGWGLIVFGRQLDLQNPAILLSENS